MDGGRGGVYRFLNLVAGDGVFFMFNEERS